MKQRLLNYVMRHIFKGFVIGDLLTYNKASKMYFLNGKQMSEPEVRILKEEAEYIKRTQLWGLVESNLTKKAHEKIVTESLNWEDVFFGKAMLYVVSVIQEFFKILVDVKK